MDAFQKTMVAVEVDSSDSSSDLQSDTQPIETDGRAAEKRGRDEDRRCSFLCIVCDRSSSVALARVKHASIVTSIVTTLAIVQVAGERQL